jgi:hypothetical protein
MKSYIKEEIYYIIGLINNKGNFIKVDTMHFSDLTQATQHLGEVLSKPKDFKLSKDMASKIRIFKEIVQTRWELL